MIKLSQLFCIRSNFNVYFQFLVFFNFQILLNFLNPKKVQGYYIWTWPLCNSVLNYMIEKKKNTQRTLYIFFAFLVDFLFTHLMVAPKFQSTVTDNELLAKFTRPLWRSCSHGGDKNTCVYL